MSFGLTIFTLVHVVLSLVGIGSSAAHPLSPRRREVVPAPAWDRQTPRTKKAKASGLTFLSRLPNGILRPPHSAKII